MKQSQFLDVIDRDEAEARWTAALKLEVLPAEVLHLGEALGRILAEDVRADVDVPSFDRSNMDGFAVQAQDTFGALEEAPVRLRHNHEVIPTGLAPSEELKPGSASTIATGGMLPRGADAVVPVEHTHLEDEGRVVVVAGFQGVDEKEESKEPSDEKKGTESAGQSAETGDVSTSEPAKAAAAGG